jgi:hypothetical protein
MAALGAHVNALDAHWLAGKDALRRAPDAVH